MMLPTLIVVTSLSMTYIAAEAVSAQSQQRRPLYKLPPTWTGTVEITVTPDRKAGVLTLDVVGGYMDSAPGSAPDGIVDWTFPLLGLTPAPSPFSGRATLRMTEGNTTFLEFLQVTPERGAPIMFRTIASTAAPESAATPVVVACRIYRLFPAWPNVRSHAQTAVDVLAPVHQDPDSLTKLCSEPVPR